MPYPFFHVITLNPLETSVSIITAVNNDSVIMTMLSFLAHTSGINSHGDNREPVEKPRACIAVNRFVRCQGGLPRATTFYVN